MSTRITDADTDPRQDHHLSRKALLKTGAVAGAGLAALSSPLGARGVALAQYSERLARQRLDATQSVSLRFITRAGPGYQAFFKAAGDAFIKQHANVSIKYEYHDTDYATKLQVELAGGVPPDLIFFSDDALYSFAARNAFVDLLPFFKQAGLKTTDFWPAAINPQFLGSHLFAMPLDYGMHIMFYNKALFDQQHLSYPTAKWTWQDFIKAGRKLTIDRSGKRADEAGFQPEHVRQYGEDGTLPYWFDNVLRGNGGEWATSNLSKALLDKPVSVKTFQFIADLGNKYFTSSSPKYATSLSFAMEHGNVAMHFDGTWQFSYYPHYPATKWQHGNIDIVPYPRGSKGSVVGAEASGLCIPRGTNSKNVQWAWEFIKFMTTDPGQRLAFKFGVASIPNSKKLASKLIPTYRQPKNTKIILELLPQAKLPPWCEAISDQELENALTSSPYSGAPSMYDLYRGRTTAAQAMPKANQAVQTLLDKDQELARKFGAKLRL